MITFLSGAVVGAIAILLVVRVNPKLALWFYKAATKVETLIEEKTGKKI